MKGFFGLIFFALSLLLVSCSDSGTQLTDSEVETLRQTVDGIAKKTYWTHELDSSVLSAKISGADGVAKQLEATPYNVSVSGAESDYEPVYPGIPGFALLDTTLLQDSARANLVGFCNAVIEKKSADSYMADGSIFSLVLFNYDMNREGMKFSQYILGEPFEGEKLLQCPVRFLGKDDFFQDVVVYLSEEKSYKISSIEFVVKESLDEPNK